MSIYQHLEYGPIVIASHITNSDPQRYEWQYCILTAIKLVLSYAI